MDVAGVEDSEILVSKHRSDGSKDVAGIVELAFNRVLMFPDGEGSTRSANFPAVLDVVDFFVSEEGIFANVELLTLTRHYADGIMEHCFREISGGEGEEDFRMGVAALKDGERAHVIEVGMGDDNGVEILVFDEAKIGEC